MVSFHFPPQKSKKKQKNPNTFRVGSSPTVMILTPVTLSSCRSPTEAEERAGVFGAAVGSAGDPLVVQVQHFRGARPLCGAAPLELWHPPQRG